MMKAVNQQGQHYDTNNGKHYQNNYETDGQGLYRGNGYNEGGTRRDGTRGECDEEDARDIGVSGEEADKEEGRCRRRRRR